ncbi:MAG: hypothetical protein ABR958_05635 [Dehalococcoidales bacterium]
MKRILFAAGIVFALAISIFISNYALASENIFGLKIENINRNGADFYWSTSNETKGSIEYAYTKLPELYNPQLPGTHQDILISVTPAQTRSEGVYLKEHHIKVDKLDLSYDPFVQYTVKSQAFNGEIYTISGEFVLVDTQKTQWWQTWQFAVLSTIIALILGWLLGWLTLEKIRKYFSHMQEKRKGKRKRQMVV